MHAGRQVPPSSISEEKEKKTVCNTSLIILLTDVVNLESVYAILNLCASLVHCKNRSPTTLTFSAKAFPRPKWADSQDSKITQPVGKGINLCTHCLADETFN